MTTLDAIADARDHDIIDICILRSGEVCWRIANRWELQPGLRVDDVESFLEAIDLKAGSPDDRRWNGAGYVVVDHSDGDGRLRVTATGRRHAPVLCIRIHGALAPTMSELQWPSRIESWSDRGQGVIVICGPGSSGKTTLGAALIRRCTETDLMCWLLESPSEYDQPSPLAIQYTVGAGKDYPTMANGVVASMTATIDAVLIGQADDANAALAAFDTARLGKLVILTILSGNVVQALEQLHLWGVPGSTLAELLIGVAALRLVPANGGTDRDTGKKLVGACELWEPDDDSLHHLRATSFSEIHDYLRSGNATLEHRLRELVDVGRIDLREARRLAPNPDEV